MQWAWVFWLALILVFIIVEVVSLEFTFLMLAVGSLAGLVSGLLGADWWVQIILAGMLSLILLFFVRPALLRTLRKGGDPALSNTDRLLGMTGRVHIAFADGRGQVRLANGETWTSRISAASTEHNPTEGEQIVVTEIDGATAVVVPATPASPAPAVTTEGTAP